MIFRYRVEYEFEAEHLGAAQEALNKGLVPAENMIIKSIEAISSEDRIIPRKFIPKGRPDVVTFGELAQDIRSPDATQSGEKPEDDQVKLPEDPPF